MKPLNNTRLNIPELKASATKAALRPKISFAKVLARSSGKKALTPQTIKTSTQKKEHAEDVQNVIGEGQKQDILKDLPVENSTTVFHETREIAQQKVSLHLMTADKAAFVVQDGLFKHTHFEVERQRYRLKLTSKNSDKYSRQLFRAHHQKLKDQLKDKRMDLVSWDIN